MTELKESNIVTLRAVTDKDLAAFVRDYVGTVKCAIKDDPKDTHTVALVDMPLVSVAAFLKKGIQRLLNDPVGSAENFPTTKSKSDHVIAHIAELQNGIVSQRSSAATVTSAEKEARKAARIFHVGSIKGSKQKSDEYKAMDTKARNELFDSIVARNPAMVVAAQAQLDAMAAMVAAIDIDIE